MDIRVIETFPGNALVEQDLLLPEDERVFVVRSVPTYLVASFEDRVEKLARRAKKLEVEAPTFVPLRNEERTWEERDEQTGRLVTHVGRFLVVGILARPVVLAGWRFVATVQHTEAGNILRTSPTWGGGEVPKAYREAAASWCDHCRTERKRTETFVVRHEDGTWFRVGRSCLADFVGHDRNGVSVASFALDVGCLLDDVDGWSGLSSGAETTPIQAFVAQTIRCIRKAGWMSRGKVREQGFGMATADLVMSIFDAHRHPSPHNEDLRSEEYMATDEDRAEAKGVIEWARDIDPETDNDYLHNLRVACTFEFLTHKETGIVASVVQAHRRHLDQIEWAAREARLPPRGTRHVASVGDKFGRKLSKQDKAKGAAALPALLATVVSTKWIETMYGSSCKVVLEVVDVEENVRDLFVWWASNPSVVEGGTVRDAKRGDRVTVLGTVKGHGEYGGMKETLLMRCDLTLTP